MGNHGDVIVDSAISGVGALGLFYLLYVLIVSAVGIGSYVLQGISFYSIAGRRGIKHAWLSWLPVGSVWILGCISDQYQYVVKRQVKNKRKVLLILGLALLAMAILVIVLCGAMIGSALEFEYSNPESDQMVGGFLGSVFGVVVASLLTSGLSIALTILQYICLYDLYTSCEPSNNVLYLLLSIFLGFLLPIFLFVCRNKDLGMPPRKAAPAQIPVEPAAWQPTQPQTEPWENPEE